MVDYACRHAVDRERWGMFTTEEEIVMTVRGDHAVVIGAGVGGLLAARVLAESFARVTVLERDALPPEPVPRKCVPQGRHAHALLARGGHAFDTLFPGFTSQLIDRGAPSCDVGSGFQWVLSGHRFALSPSGVRAIGASRPLIEWQLRTRVCALPNVEIAEHTSAVDFAGDRAHRRVTGVATRRRAGRALGEVVEADLVVDASGRSSQTLPWLEAFGCARPAEDRMTIDLAYATRHFRRDPADFDGRLGLGVGATPDHPRAGVIIAQENGTWIVTVSGYAHDEPPVDADAFTAFAASLPAPEFGRFVAEAEPLDEPLRYRIPTTVRRRYAEVPLPEGYLPFADTICCFNPIYGQGMSVAGVEALALRDCLRDGVEALAPRFLNRIRRGLDDTWTMAADSDLQMPCVAGPRSTRTRLANAYTVRVHRAAVTDPRVGAQFLRVINLLDRPTSLLRPATAARVLRGNVWPRPVPEDTVRPSATPGVRRGERIAEG
ncbi:FAD-binding monooxygenase [Rhodococcus olei]|uniref:FAD-binding monooxygenase n=1 Tax=Rhodococcus olei TaxID=2161675 RepID=A0ABP8PI18_9NOCA